MTGSISWNGTEGAWSEPGNWIPAGVPAAGDSVTIQSGVVHVSALTLDGLTIQLGSSDAGNPATMIFAGDCAITATTTIAGSDVSAELRIPGSLSVAGTIAAGCSGTPFFIIGVGSLELQAGSQLAATAGYDIVLRPGEGWVNDGEIIVAGATVYSDVPLSGSGSVSISQGGQMQMWASVAAGQTMGFLDGTGLLLISDPADFGATITGAQPGITLALPDSFVDAASLDADDGILTLSYEGETVGELTLSGAAEALSFVPSFSREGGTLLFTSLAARQWDGTDGDWYDSARWTTESGQVSVPLAGDTALIQGGTATVSATGLGQFGQVHDMQILLNGTASDPAGIAGSGLILDSDSTLSVTGDSSHGRLLLSGTNTLLAEVAVLSRRGCMTFRLDGSGPLNIGDTSLVVGAGSTMRFFGGEVANGGLITVTGKLYLGPDATLDGTGLIDIFHGGMVVIDGTVGDGQVVHFGDLRGKLQLGNLRAFEAEIVDFQQGDVIILPGLLADTPSYDDTEGVLTLYADGQPVGSLWIWADTVFDEEPGQFSLAPDGQGGTLVTYTAQPVIVDASIPVAALGTADQMVAFSDILVNAFGEVPPGFAAFTLSQASSEQQSGPNESYWGQPTQDPPGEGYDPAWYIKGERVIADGGDPPVVLAADIGDVQFLVGNQIYASAWFGVTTATDSLGNPTQITKYNMWSVDPGVSTYQPGVAPAGAAAMVKSVNTYATVYDDVQNYDNCNWIADNVAAGMGATMPYLNYSNDPDENQSGGFWRIVHNGTKDPVADWSQLVQPGDVVRLGWAGIEVDDNSPSIGWHTTTIFQADAAMGLMEVYDNIDYRPDGSGNEVSYIGLHDAIYWTDTVPQSITIYRMAPVAQYLIQGASPAEYIHGTVFDDLIRPVGGGGTITTGQGHNEIEGTIADLDGVTVTDFGVGDRFNVTDLPASEASVSFDAGSGLLTVLANGNAVAGFNLPSQPDGRGFATAADARGGTLIYAS
ncbi:hypothetical protein [Roseococcus sp. YIM B11640]|uniref:hypothetical protein n=1 Tax=Roseococcus sp. YIM B11640 TaxID=3133973 RepID=UPI003C7D694B